MEALPANRTWPPSCSHGTYQHKAITSRSRQLLMMGTWLRETCLATIRREIKNTKSDIYLVFLIHTELRCTVNHTSDLCDCFIIKIRRTKQNPFLSNCHENCNQYRQAYPDYLFKKHLLSPYRVICISVAAQAVQRRCTNKTSYRV